MLLLSGGWPYNPAEYTVNDYDADFVDVVSAGADPRSGRAQLYGPLADAANLLGYTLYPVDVPGLVRESRDASVGAPSNEPAALAGGSFPRELQSHASLEYLAQGDRRRGADQRRAATRRSSATSADTRSYYWLGFTPDADAGRQAARDQGRGADAPASRCGRARASSTSRSPRSSR